MKAVRAFGFTAGNGWSWSAWPPEWSTESWPVSRVPSSTPSSASPTVDQIVEQLEQVGTMDPEAMEMVTRFMESTGPAAFAVAGIFFSLLFARHLRGHRRPHRRRALQGGTAPSRNGSRRPAVDHRPARPRRRMQSAASARVQPVNLSPEASSRQGAGEPTMRQRPGGREGTFDVERSTMRLSTSKWPGTPDHRALLSSGWAGELGSRLSNREGGAFPIPNFAFRPRLPPSADSPALVLPTHPPTETSCALVA